MPSIHLRRALSAVLLIPIMTMPARDAGARVAATAGDRIATATPVPVLPLAGDRVSESTARFEVTPGSGAEVRVVIAKFPFDPSVWSALPASPGWTVVPCGSGPIAIEPLGLADRTDTRLWWTVVWTDGRSGALRASEVRDFTLVPRFANRVAPGGILRPSNSGRLPARAVVARPDAPRRAIELAAGYTVEPGAPGPALPGSLRRSEGAASPARPDGRDAWLVQFADGSPDSARARIAAAGGALVWPLAGDAYLVRMDAGARGRLQTAGGAPWIEPYEAAYKLSAAFPDSGEGPVDATALLFNDGDGGATIQALRALGAANLTAHRSSLNHLVRFELDRSLLAAAASLADVAWIEPTLVYSPTNDQAQWVVQSGVQNSRPVSDQGIRGQGQIVMVSDSGIRTNHEMFGDSTLAIDTWGDYPGHRKIIAYQPGSDSPQITFGDDADFSYHGTHVAGTVAGNPEPTSAAPWSGMAKDARIYFVDIAGDQGGSYRLPADLNDLYQPSYTGNAGGAARISSHSWGASSGGGTYTLFAMQTDQFAWSHPDYLIAFAAGNVGIFGAVYPPATAKNCLTVGAVGNGADMNKLASFSSRGPTRDGRRKPTVVAPGNTVVSSVGSTRYAYSGYAGTSMATPAVSGAMALVRQYLTQGWYPTGAPVAANALEPSAALMRAMAVAAARNDVISFRAPDNSIGFGRLTIDDVLYFPGDSLRTVLVDPEDGLTDLQFAEYQVEVTDPSRPLKIALCWTDAPGNPASTVQIVNDLDLVVTHNGLTYRGNYLLNNVSVAGGVRDSLNVEEFVRLAAPGAGLWTVRVEGRRVVLGPQRFALCITGGVGGPTGAVALDRFQYGLSDTLEVEVIDTDASGPLTVRVSSGTEPWGEPMTLTGENGVFHGSIPIGPVAPHPVADGILAVSSGDLVTVSYTEASAGAELHASARVNVQAPTITNVHATALSGTQALVTWNTDLGSSSRVWFGAAGIINSTVDSAGFTVQHAVLLTGLRPGTTYRYDVESVTNGGDASRDSLDGAHRSFTTRRTGSIALLMDDPNVAVHKTWANALAALGWEADVLPAAMNEPPLVGDSSAGLRSYNAVLWQVDPNKYPPFSDAQRAAIDSLLEGGGRLLVTGHDIGFGLSDMGAPSYTPEREAWIESSLKTRYHADNIWADTLTGVAGSPVAGAFADSLAYAFWLYPDSGDNIAAAPGTDGVWSGDWTENYLGFGHMGMHWESNTPRGTPGDGVWGGRNSRLVGLFYEWRSLVGESTSHLPDRTAVLRDAAAWLMEHRPPDVRILLPAPGTVVTSDYVPIRYSILPDAGRTIVDRDVEYSLDGGETWAAVTTAAKADSGCIWDLAGVLGGPPTPNSTRVLLRVRVTDDGSPSLQCTAQMSSPFTLARPGGDARGPVLVAGSASCNPVPIRTGRTTTLFATFSDAEAGGGGVFAAEYSLGANPAAAGSGTSMAGTFGASTVQASAVLATGGVGDGTLTVWVRGRDAANNWGAASALTVPTSGGGGTLAVGDAGAVDFLATPSPNPFRGSATIRFGLARAGEARLELFDIAGRRVSTLASGKHDPGAHVATWNGRDQQGNVVRAGIYFIRLRTPSRTFHARVVALR